MSTYKTLLDHVDKSLRGHNSFIPNPHKRMQNIFNIYRAQYTLIGSNTGVGKTSYVDDSFVLRPYDWIVSQNSTDTHYEGLYFSMERKKIFKLAKWTSWLLYEKKGIKIPYNVILGHDPLRKLTRKEDLILKDFESVIEPLLEIIDIQDGIKTVKEIARQIQKKAIALGAYFTTDNEQLYLNGTSKASFLVSGKSRTTKRGKVKYIKFNYKGKSYKLEANSNVYIPHKPNTFLFIFIDHIGKISLSGYHTKKQAIDGLDEVLSEARDKFGFSPIAISQFNRAVGDIHRIRESKGNLEPILEDFKDSGNTQESADLILSMFDPYNYGSYDTQGKYKGYDITNGTLSPTGSQRFRSLHILKNSYGPNKIAYGMRFTGELMRFDQLPLPSDPKLAGIYADIANGH